MNRILKTAASATIACLLASSPAAAATQLFFDDFNGENGGNTAQNYAAFANFEVNFPNQVDLMDMAGFGIAGHGLAVDLAGTPGPGRLQTKQAFAFNAGDTLTFSLDIAGDQRDGGFEDFFAGFQFSKNTKFADYTLGGAFIPTNLGAFDTTSIATGQNISDVAPFKTFTLAFTAKEAGTVRLFIGSTADDNDGTLLDNVRLVNNDAGLSAGGVPEPASWALMIAGFGGAGAALRRRRAATVFA